MNIKRATAILGAALVIAGSPALASATDMQSGPIHIEKVVLSGGYYTNPDGDTGILPGAATISFTNQSPVAATDVVFAVENHGWVAERLNDVGSFAPGVAIHHRLPASEVNGDLRVTVAQATFANGTTWQNPDVPAPSNLNTNLGVAPSAY